MRFSNKTTLNTYYTVIKSVKCVFTMPILLREDKDQEKRQIFSFNVQLLTHFINC